MRTLVTGGAGFIGSAVIRQLQREGHDVYVLDNLSFGSRSFIDIGDSAFFHADIRDAESVETIIGKVRPETVIHLAAVHFIPYCNEHPFESSDINIRGTINLLDACRKHDIKRFFFASTAAVYPISDVAVSENHSVGPLDIYGLSKLTGEHLCNEYHLCTGVPVVICRFFNAFGPNETNPHLIPEIQRQVNGGSRRIRLGNLAPRRDFIHTSDMAAAVTTLLDHCNSGIETYNLGRGLEYSVIEIVEAFSAALGETIEIEVDPARVRKVERMHLLADISKLKALGWEPKTGIEEGIATLLNG